MLAALLTFAGVAAVVNLTPGLDMMLVLRTSVSGGRRTGVAAALGVNTGCLAWGLATAAGLSALLAASHVAFDVVRVTGAAYLTWLGLSALWRARRRPGGDSSPAVAQAQAAAQVSAGPVSAGPVSAGEPREKLAAFRAGLGTNLLNPKAGVFYMSLLPQFVPHGAPVFGTTLLLTVIDIAELMALYLVVSGAAAALAHRISRASFKRRMEQVSGVVFLGFAASLAFDRG
jgi:threonine/homoserine/homoserine lactone efflux protein